MVSSYTASLGLEKQGDGENSGTWGQKANVDRDSIDAAIAGMASVAFTNADVTLTSTDGVANQARNAILKATGTLSGNVAMIVPAKSKIYVVWNATSGAYTFTVKTASGSGIVVPTGSMMVLFCDGTNVLSINNVPSLETFAIAVSDETTAITTGAAKVTFRMPYAFTITSVRASLSTVSSSGNPAIDINEGGVSIFSTTLTIDANELTSTTAATAAVISDTSLADDAEITIDIDTAGTGAKGLKVYIIGRRTV